MTTNNNSCCAECGEEGGVGLKACKSCMQAKYCNAECQLKHWPTHKKDCKLRAAELRDEALFKDPPPKEDCPICFLPMPEKLICCMSLPPATISAVPINDFVQANEGSAKTATKTIIHVAERAFATGVYIPSVNLETMVSVPFVMQGLEAKQMKSRLQ
jgi:hypothetical protein